MVIAIIISIVLAIISIALAVQLLSLKSEMRKLKKELALTRDKGYNRQLTVSLIDKDFSTLVTEMNKNLDYQKQLKLQSEQAERSLKQSVSDIAHDLRTPLTVIKGNLQMLEREEKLSERGMGYLRVCGEKSEAMKQMADEFFELSVLESDSIEIALSKVNITNLLMQFIADNEAVIRSCRLTPDVIFSEKTVFAFADEQLLLRMFSNLLNNIVKYAESEFTIALKANENKCVITFSNPVNSGNIDTEHLFERTYRADKSRHGTSAGLGLYIVKLLAQKQGAEVAAELEDNVLKIRVVLNGTE
ncbi:MAG: HAMP domain-containing histidine kinase [Oscillospiraceae bacterium]|nr:HAMP domain-containing histidine kinase [Oscillospiraceae bacterium]